MADEDAKSARARFKSKLHRVFKEKEEQNANVEPWQLTPDVADFLKPSIEKAQSTRLPAHLAPKIDVAIAQRWPSAQPLRTPSGSLATPNGFKKPARRKGLMVGFVNSEPEFIAEGGEDSEEPPIEVARRKATMLASGMLQSPALGQGGLQTTRQAGVSDEGGVPFVPRPILRVQTSNYENTTAMQRRQVPSSSSAVERDFPKLGRVPTGFGLPAEETSAVSDDDDDDEDDEDASMPQADSRFMRYQTDAISSPHSAGYGVSPASARDLPSSATRRREIGSGEGMVLRRAGAMINDQNLDDNEKRQNLAAGVQPPSQHYDILSRPYAPSVMPEPRPLLPPNSAAASAGSSNFIASNNPYRNSRQSMLIELPVPLLAEQDQPSLAPFRRDIEAARPHSLGEDQLTNMRVPSEGFRGRDSTLAPIPVLTDSLELKQPQQMYSRSNGSDKNLGFSPPPSASAQSRSSSRDSASQPVQHSAGARAQPSPLSRIAGATSSPHNASPQSFTYGRQSGSPSASNLSPATGHSKYFLSHINRASSPRDGLSATPGSSGSNPGQERPAVSMPTSVPQQLSSQQVAAQANQSSLSADREHIWRPTSATSTGSGYRSASGAPMDQMDPYAPQKPIDRLGSAPRSATSETPGSAQRPPLSPQPSTERNPAAEAAYADFCARVAHMKGVLSLTAQRERSGQSPAAVWLRCALWWYHTGKAGLETLLRQRKGMKEGQIQELLMQPHVDLAKAWWILSDPLEPYDSFEDAHQAGDALNQSGWDFMLRQSTALLKSHIKSLSLSMSRSMLMPPPQSLIQGQDTRIWVPYPLFPLGAALALGSHAHDGRFDMPLRPSLDPIPALPLGDTRDEHCYGRFPVEVTVNTDDATSDRIPLPCMLTMVRQKRDFGYTIIIASQNELVNVKLGPGRGNDSQLTWYDVTWRNSGNGMTIQLPHEFQMTVHIQEHDFRALWNLLQYAHRVEDSLRHGRDEALVHEAPLAELQYANAANPKAFPKDKVVGAIVYVFERTRRVPGASGERNTHRNYRLVLATDPRNRSLAYASHDVCRTGPLYFEFITDAAAHGMAAMVIRIREDTEQCRMLLVFPDVSARQACYDVLNGVANGPAEMVVGKMSLASMNIEQATQVSGFTMQPHRALDALEWQKLGVNNATPESIPMDASATVESESLRIVARHTTGCITDRLNLNKGELLLRLPCVNHLAIQLLRDPQEDMTVSIDTRHSSAEVVDGITELVQSVRQQPSIRTFTFASTDDLHSFQTAITGHHVRYDGLASVLSIARRRMVVPIHKKWEATNVRLQVVSCDTVVQVLAFMEDFSHTDAMCFQVKSMDTFESVKGDGKNKKWAVKLVDAKFALPHIPENHNGEGHAVEDMPARVRRRFVNLEGLDYAEEHDDLIFAFDTQADRDRFAQALPAAAATAKRGITLKKPDLTSLMNLSTF